MIYLVIEGKINSNEKALEQRAFLVERIQQHLV